MRDALLSHSAIPFSDIARLSISARLVLVCDVYHENYYIS